MRILLDTHLYVWFLADAPELTKKVRRAIDEADEVAVSAASIWELAIKAALGKIRIDIRRATEGIAASGFVELPVRAVHAAAVAELPSHHRDPFDRLLVAQAMSEPLTLLTADRALVRYTPLVRVL